MKIINAFGLLLIVVAFTAAFTAGYEAGKSRSHRETLTANLPTNDAWGTYGQSGTSLPPLAPLCKPKATAIAIEWPDGDVANICTTQNYIALDDWKAKH
jgi:hypothetical protein